MTRDEIDAHFNEQEAISLLDRVLIKNGVLNSEAFEAIFDAIAEPVAEDNEPEDEEDAEAYHDCTLKHQVFDYFRGTLRHDGVWAQAYDLSTVAAAAMGSYDGVVEMLQDLGLMPGDQVPGPLSESVEGCPICSKPMKSCCRCSTHIEHTQESLAHGHGMSCVNGHRWSRNKDGQVIVAAS